MSLISGAPKRDWFICSPDRILTIIAACGDWAGLAPIRTGTYLHKLAGHTDVVLDVAFAPQAAQV